MLEFTLKCCVFYWFGQMYDKYSGLPGGANGKEPACQCWRHKRHGLDP